jgi:hypothetical protein
MDRSPPRLRLGSKSPKNSGLISSNFYPQNSNPRTQEKSSCAIFRRLYGEIEAQEEGMSNPLVNFRCRRSTGGRLSLSPSLEKRKSPPRAVVTPFSAAFDPRRGSPPSPVHFDQFHTPSHRP